MAKKRTPTGVVPRDSSIRIWFMWQGERHFATLPIDPTPANIKYAAKMREEICVRISIGTFDYAEFFPNSKIAQAQQQEKITFSDMAEKWLQTVSHLAPSTLKSYRRMLKQYATPVFGKLPIEQIKYSDVAAHIGSIQWKSMKTRNNVLTVFRQPFELAFMDGLIESNIAERLTNSQYQKEPPDPFTLEEAELILSELAKMDEQSFYNYFEFAFFTGLRTSELAALTWDKVDFHNQTVRINRAMVDGIVKDTKSYEVRDVELNSRAMAALQRQKKHTFLKWENVFIDPKDRRPLVNDKIVWRPWQRAIKSAGVRYRKPYNTRHTFATLNLMAGANPMWVSRQMGHKNMKMLLENYSRWIDMADKQREKNKIEQLFSENVPILCQEKIKSG